VATSRSLPLVSGDDTAFPADAVEVGRVVGAWGVKGAFKVQAHAAEPEALFSSKRWFLRGPETAGPAPRQAALPTLLRITQARAQAGAVVATAQEVLDRDAAAALTGARVYVSRASFPTAGEGEYYWVDLIGLAVVNREGVTIGKVTDLIDTGVHSVLRVRRPDSSPGLAPDQAEHLIPFVAAYVDSVDLAGGLVRVDWGLDF
jgi:16S rRNA processing protein RimM